jgi:hypothetical protein
MVDRLERERGVEAIRKVEVLERARQTVTTPQ